MKLDPNHFVHVSIHNQFIDYCSMVEYDLLNPNNIFILEDQENYIHKIEHYPDMLKLTDYQHQYKTLVDQIRSCHTILETIDHKVFKYLVISNDRY